MDKWLRDRAFHSWVNPQDFKNKEDWEWAELNAYHNAQVAKQILEEVDGMIGQAEYLRKKERGEVKDNFADFFRKLA